MRKTYYIIIVEEDEAVYEKIVRALQKLGCDCEARRVTTEGDLDDELVRLAPDFVICAHSRSDWNTFAVLKQVREFEATMPVALLSTGLDQDAQATALAGGVSACFDCDHLAELAPTVSDLLKRRTERQMHSVEEIRRNVFRPDSNPPVNVPEWRFRLG